MTTEFKDIKNFQLPLCFAYEAETSTLHFYMPEFRVKFPKELLPELLAQVAKDVDQDPSFPTTAQWSISLHEFDDATLEQIQSYITTRKEEKRIGVWGPIFL